MGIRQTQWTYHLKPKSAGLRLDKPKSPSLARGKAPVPSTNLGAVAPRHFGVIYESCMCVDIDLEIDLDIRIYIDLKQYRYRYIIYRY